MRRAPLILSAAILSAAQLGSCSASLSLSCQKSPATASPPSVASHSAVSSSRQGPVISEAYARELLAAQFRAAGLRVVYDRPIRNGAALLYADGVDPARKLAYEYVDSSERDLPGHSPTPRQTFGDYKLLLVGPSSAQAVLQAVALFLAQHQLAAP